MTQMGAAGDQATQKVAQVGPKMSAGKAASASKDMFDDLTDGYSAAE